MAQQALEGTWEEIRAHDSELIGRRVRLILIDGDWPNEPDGRANPYPLQGSTPYSYSDPFEPAIPIDEWEN